MPFPGGNELVMPLLKYFWSLVSVMPVMALAASLQRNTSGYACSSGVERIDADLLAVVGSESEPLLDPLLPHWNASSNTPPAREPNPNGASTQ